VLLDCEASNGAALEIGSGRAGAKQLALDVDGEIADPASDTKPRAPNPIRAMTVSVLPCAADDSNS
jgi:hypothetical protein